MQGKIDPDTFTKKISKKKLGGALVCSFLSRCEESTIYDKQEMKYLCEETIEKRKENIFKNKRDGGIIRRFKNQRKPKISDEEITKVMREK